MALTPDTTKERRAPGFASKLTVVAFFVYMNAVFIPREEATLERVFGAEYAGYRRRVRRWL